MKNPFEVGLDSSGDWKCPICGTDEIRQSWTGWGNEFFRASKHGLDYVECQTEEITDREEMRCCGCDGVFTDEQGMIIYSEDELIAWFQRNCK